MKYPTKDEWIKIQENSNIDKLKLTVAIPQSTDIFTFAINQELRSWIRLFNNRLGETRMSYVLFMSNFNEGIPDEQWYISPGFNGESIQYFPHFEEKNFHFKSMFDYYVDIFYYKFFSAWDTMFHILNTHQQFDVNSGIGFNNKVLNKLKVTNQELHNIIKETDNSASFIKSRDLRNNITHNFAPNEVSSGLTKLKRNGELKRIDVGIGSYTPSSIFVENINGVIEEFSNLLKVIEKNLEGPRS